MTTATISATSIETAAREYLSLRDRASNPAGTFDRQGRFYLTQRYACCAGIRRPSAAYPYSEMTHGRTAEHVAHAHNVPACDVRKTGRQLDK